MRRYAHKYGSNPQTCTWATRVEEVEGGNPLGVLPVLRPSPFQHLLGAGLPRLLAATSFFFPICQARSYHWKVEGASVPNAVYFSLPKPQCHNANIVPANVSYGNMLFLKGNSNGCFWVCAELTFPCRHSIKWPMVMRLGMACGLMMTSGLIPSHVNGMSCTYKPWATTQTKLQDLKACGTWLTVTRSEDTTQCPGQAKATRWGTGATGTGHYPWIYQTEMCGLS